METTDLARELVEDNDPILKEKIKSFDVRARHEDADLAKLAHTLAQSALKLNLPALAANQIGLRERAIVLVAEPIICMINPRIVHYSDETDLHIEANVHVPNLACKVRRSSEIRVRYLQPNLDMMTQKFRGISSWLVQQHVDLLNGIMYTDKVTKIHMEQAKKKKVI